MSSCMLKKQLNSFLFSFTKLYTKFSTFSRWPSILISRFVSFPFKDRDHAFAFWYLQFIVKNIKKLRDVLLHAYFQQQFPFLVSVWTRKASKSCWNYHLTLDILSTKKWHKKHQHHKKTVANDWHHQRTTLFVTIN